MQCKREPSRTRRAIAADRSVNDIAEQAVMTRENVMSTREGKKRVTITRQTMIFSVSETRRPKETRRSIRPAMSDEPKDAVTRGRGVGDHRRAAGTENLSDQTSHTAEHVVVNYFPVDRGHRPRTINHEVAQC